MGLKSFALIILFTFNIGYLSSGVDGFFNGALRWIDNNILDCKLKSCCNDFRFSSEALEYDLRKEVHGQHLVVDNVVKIIRGHLYNDNPDKALVLSFHGWTGCGKNFVTQIVARNIFDGGVSSRHVKTFISTHDFPHGNRLEQYKDALVRTIRDQVKRCNRALFIFDEVDKMPSTLLDVMRPYLDVHPSVGGVDYRKATFIFLSNTGSNAINSITLNHWEEGKKREDITLIAMEQAIADSAYNEVEGGLWHASLIELNLITAFLPFLPLERYHVSLCIQDELRRFNIHPEQEVIQNISKDILFWPKDVQVFSTSGCKRVSKKVGEFRYSVAVDKIRTIEL